MPQDVRGVYVFDHLSTEGFPIYYAVSSDNRCVACRIRYPFEDDASVISELDALLDQEDPISSHP